MTSVRRDRHYSNLYEYATNPADVGNSFFVGGDVQEVVIGVSGTAGTDDDGVAAAAGLLTVRRSDSASPTESSSSSTLSGSGSISPLASADCWTPSGPAATNKKAQRRSSRQLSQPPPPKQNGKLAAQSSTCKFFKYFLYRLRKS